MIEEMCGDCQHDKVGVSFDGETMTPFLVGRMLRTIC